MATQYIMNEKGEATSVIIPIGEYEDLLHHHHNGLELTSEYKKMIDKMLAEEERGEMTYVSLEEIKAQFKN